MNLLSFISASPTIFLSFLGLPPNLFLSPTPLMVVSPYFTNPFSLPQTSIIQHTHLFNSSSQLSNPLPILLILLPLSTDHLPPPSFSLKNFHK